MLRKEENPHIYLGLIQLKYPIKGVVEITKKSPKHFAIANLCPDKEVKWLLSWYHVIVVYTAWKSRQLCENEKKMNDVAEASRISFSR